jgi:hypothetical protein
MSILKNKDKDKGGKNKPVEPEIEQPQAETPDVPPHVYQIPDVPPIPGPPPAGIPVKDISPGGKFLLDGQLYWKQGTSSRIVGVKLIKTQGGDTWMPDGADVLDPDTLVEPY